MSSKVVYECDYCRCEIGEGNLYRSLGKVLTGGVSLCFFLWDDPDAKSLGTLHFCTDTHAERYLVHWLDEQRKKQEAGKAPVVDAEFPEVGEEGKWPVELADPEPVPPTISITGLQGDKPVDVKVVQEPTEIDGIPF